MPGFVRSFLSNQPMPTRIRFYSYGQFKNFARKIRLGDEQYVLILFIVKKFIND